MKKILFSFLIIIVTFSVLTFVLSFIKIPTQKAYSVYLESASSTTPTIDYGLLPTMINTDFLNKTKNSLISKEIDFIEVNLEKMKLSLYKKGQIISVFDIQSKGRPGSWWETPIGIYKIESKIKNHFSSIGHVYQPWSLQFQGNFFIHGWPYYEGGLETSSQFTGGCVKLKTDDAKNLYNEVVVGTPVIVFNEEYKKDEFKYKFKLPELSGTNFLAADLDSNFVFTEKNTSEIVPIASITKLMTALVSAEYINLGKNIVVNKEYLIQTSKSRLVHGMNIEAFELLHLLLEESSNEAAEVLANSIGRDYFVGLMNKKALAIGLKNTTFVDPSGISSDNVSTAEDLFILANYIINNRSFILKISAGQLNGGINKDFSFPNLNNFNQFSDQVEFVGGKIGKTKEAGETIISIFNLNFGNNLRQIVFISLGSLDVKNDILTLRDFVQKNFSY
jgi:serine-type D-Ala-D-Ala endopeptidase (penicillin-binding protein 7)